MRNLLRLLICLLPISAQAQIAAPEKVDVGQAIHFQYEEAQAGDVIRWDLLNPWPEPDLSEIVTKYGTDYIIDPPCSWTGKVRVQVIVTDKVGLVRFIGNKSVSVEGAIVLPPTPGPTPPPTPTPPKPEYDGANALSVGQVSFDNAPEFDQAVANLYKNAAGYLYGKPSVKVIYSQDSYKNSTDYNVFVWLRNQLESKPEWAGHYNAVFEASADKNIVIGSPLSKWREVMLEIAAGIEGKE